MSRYRYLTAAAVLLFSAVCASSAIAASIIHVSLKDNGPEAAMADNMGMGLSADTSTAAMRVVVDAQTVPAGEITFAVTNDSKDLVHEMLVVKVADIGSQLPYNLDDARIDEDKAGSLGEVSELDPGKAGSLTLKLDPGTYALLCNMPGHFMTGMWTTISVK